MEEELQFYRTPGHYTDPNEFRLFLQSLPDDVEEIVRFIKRILIHPLEARNNRVRFNYKMALRAQADHRSVDAVLSSPKVYQLLLQKTLHPESDPSERGIFGCDHHAVLLTAILRLKARAVRSRCGYATYLVPGMYTPHWVCEVYDAHTRKWKLVDPEQGIPDIEQGAFLPAGKVWLGLKNDQIALDDVLPDYRDGMDGVKYRLLNDINALMKNELLNYDWMIKEAVPRKPGIFSKPMVDLDETEHSLLNMLAELSADDEPDLPVICAKYATYVHAENLWG